MGSMNRSGSGSRMKTLTAFGRGALLCVLLAATVRADFESDHARLKGELVTRLEALAVWCDEAGLPADGKRLYEHLLALAPDHVAAHEALGYRLKKDGSWAEPSTKKRSRRAETVAEASAGLRAELKQRRREAIAPYRDAALALLDAEPSAPADALDRVQGIVLAIDADDAEVHHQRGEQRYGNAWVLAETARAYDRRPELRVIIADSVRRAGSPDVLTKGDARDAESAGLGLPGLDLQWSANARTHDVQVFGTGLLEESLRAAQAAHAAGDVFRHVFEAGTRHPPGFTVYLLTRQAELAPFLDALPDLSADERAFLAQLVGSGIPLTANTAQWAGSIARRLDGTVRHTLGIFLLSEFRITTDTAWAWEGIGLYLTRELVGTRLTWYIAGADEDTELARLRADLLVQEANWMNAAWQLLRGSRAPDLGDVMRQDTGAMGVDGMLASYALCAYLLEGRPRELIELLFRAGRGEDPETAVPEALGLSLEELSERLERWLSERRRPEYYRS